MLPTEQLSYEEIERMRAILAQHDSGSGRKSINEFDLNKPPVAPYRFQEFPKLMYRHETGKYLTVHSKAAEEAAIEKGWKLEPFPAAAPEFEPEEDEAAEIARLDKIARKPKKTDK